LPILTLFFLPSRDQVGSRTSASKNPAEQPVEPWGFRRCFFAICRRVLIEKVEFGDRSRATPNATPSLTDLQGEKNEENQ